MAIFTAAKLSSNALKVLEHRCLVRDEQGSPAETPEEMFRRVAREVARADKLYKDRDPSRSEEEFFRIMSSLEFLPNSPTLANAGTPVGQLAACFVLPVKDSLDDIFSSIRNMAIVHQSGGGTGFSFSRLRPQGAFVKTSGGKASGPVSFMRIFDVATEVVRQGGRRRGANMAVLRVDHPDVLAFATAKLDMKSFSNFNLSVAVTDSFMDALAKGAAYELRDPASGRVVNKIKASEVFDIITTSAWKCGDPGIIFIDEVNRHNPTPQVGPIEATNPCGEQPLLEYEACNLGSLNILAVTTEKGIDWNHLRRNVQVAVRFLDNVIDVSRYPLEQTVRMTHANRKIGLGVMGFAEALIKMGIPYDSEEGIRRGEELMSFMTGESEKESCRIARKRGVFPNFDGSLWRIRRLRMRNAATTTVAPTGTISIIAGVSSGIEPVFALGYEREALEGEILENRNQLFAREMERRNLASPERMAEVNRRGSIRAMEGIPDDMRRVFGTALDIAPLWHVRMQAAFQKHTHSAVSKTVNLPHDATVEDIRQIYLKAHELKCKGITVYRYGCKGEQVLKLADWNQNNPCKPASPQEGESDDDCSSCRT